MSSTIFLQLAETLQKTSQQLALHETKVSVDLTKIQRERDEYKKDRDELRRQLDQLRAQRDSEIDDLRQQRDQATHRSHELQLEKESWKQNAQTSKVSLENALNNYQRLEEQYARLKEDSDELKTQSERWQREYLRVEKDNIRWQAQYLHADEERNALTSRIGDLVEEQLELNRAAIDSTPITPHIPRNHVPPRTTSSSTGLLRRPAASTHRMTSSIDVTATESISAPVTKSRLLRGVTSSRPAVKPKNSATSSGIGRSEPPPPYNKDGSSSASSSHRNKRQRTESDVRPFRATSSTLIRRVENVPIPDIVKDEEESDQGELLVSPKKPAVPTRSSRGANVNPRKRSQALSEEEEEEAEEYSDEPAEPFSSRLSRSYHTTSQIQDEDEDSDDELHLAPSVPRSQMASATFLERKGHPQPTKMSRAKRR